MPFKFNYLHEAVSMDDVGTLQFQVYSKVNL